MHVSIFVQDTQENAPKENTQMANPVPKIRIGRHPKDTTKITPRKTNGRLHQHTKQTPTINKKKRKPQEVGKARGRQGTLVPPPQNPSNSST